MSIERFTKIARFGIGVSLTGMVVSVCAILLSLPESSRAQIGPDVIVPGAVKLAETLPTDDMRLSLTSTIVMALTLMASVTAFLAAYDKLRKDAMAQSAKFSETMMAFANKPCLMESAQGEAIMQQALVRARRKGE